MVCCTFVFLNKIVSIFEASQDHSYLFLSFFFILLKASSLPRCYPRLWEPGAPGTRGRGLSGPWTSMRTTEIHGDTMFWPRGLLHTEAPTAVTQPPQATVPNAQCPGVHGQTSLWWAPVLSCTNPLPLCPSRLQKPCSLLGWDQHLPQKHQPPYPCRQHNSVSIINTNQRLYDGFHTCNFQLFISTKRCEFSPVTKTQ